MKKYLLCVLALALVCGMGLIAQSEDHIGLEIGVLAYKCNEGTAESGSANFLKVILPIDDKAAIGFYHEQLGVNLEDNDGGGVPTQVNLDIDIQGLYGGRKISDKFSAGLHVGMANVTARLAGAVQFQDTVPMGDVFITWNIIGGGTDVKADMKATLGYRTLVVPAASPDGGADFGDNVSDLGGGWVAVSLSIRF